MESLLADALKGLGAAAAPVLILWWRGKEMREDLVALRAENAALKERLLKLLADSIRADLTNTLVLEKIADKVGA